VSAPTITLDSNGIINLFDRDSKTATSVEALFTLMRYALSGKAKLSITTRVEADLLSDKDNERQQKMMRFLELVPVVGSVGRWDTSNWDSGDVYVGPNHEQLIDEVQKIVFPGLSSADKRHKNKLNDIDHLVGHKLHGRDIFVTDDRGIWRRRAELKTGPGIVVMTPGECVEYIDEIEVRETPRLFQTEDINPAYYSKKLQDQVTFDYSNNDHRFSIGEGHFYFQTSWSKASDISIYAYADAASISGIGLVKDVAQIREIVDGTRYDFSSRTRTPGLGQIVIWRNVNGIYAATKILAIKDDNRGDDHDELIFEYVILADGGSDFSKTPKP
jgi:hypothetical protein